MFNREMVHKDFGSLEEGFASLAGGGRELSLLLAAHEGPRATLARAQEHAALEAQDDILLQADEALVMG